MPLPPPTSSAVVGRHGPRSRARGAVVAPAGPGALLWVGEPGVGKTVLWQEAVGEATAAGHVVLVARCFDEERSNVLVGLSDLLDRAGAAGPTAIPDGLLDASNDSLGRARLLLSWLRRVARTTPVVVAIDDLQWLDDLSAQTLRHVLRRLVDEPVLVLATMRPEPPSPGPSPDPSPDPSPGPSPGPGRDPLMLESSLGPGRTLEMVVGPMDRGDLRALLGSDQPLSPMTLSRIHQASGGNPLYALELARVMSDRDVLGLSPGLPLPTSIASAMGHRLDGLPPDARRLVDLLAVGGPVQVQSLEVAGDDPVDDRALAEAVAAGLVVATGDRISFTHPLVGSTAYRRMDPRRRRALHARLADGLQDPDARARHLALSTDGPDPDAAEVLEQAALRSAGRGAPAAAARFARQAVRLTPPGRLADLKRRALEEVHGLAVAGEVARAGARLDSLLAALPPGPDRADLWAQRFYLGTQRSDRTEAMLLQALEEAGDDVRMRAQVLDLLGFHRGVFRQDLVNGIETSRAAVALADDPGTEELWSRAAGHLGHMLAMAGRPDPTLMARAMAASRRSGGPVLGGGPHAWWAKQLLWAGDLAGCHDALEQVEAWTAARGHQIERPYRAYDRALLAIAAGDLAAAGTAIEAGMAVALDSGNRDAEGWLAHPAALLALWQGDLRGARDHADRLAGWPGMPGGRLGRARADHVRGLVAIADDRPLAAVEPLLAAVALVGDEGLAHPGAEPVLPDAVIALVAAGRVDEAGRHRDRLVAQADRLDLPRPDALAGWASGLVAVAQGDVDGGLAALAAAATTLEDLGLRPEAARCRLDEGRAARRVGLRARAARSLSTARTGFTEVGAVGWAGLAATELDRVAPGTTAGGLTATEGRVAGLVAGGATNRDVAATTYMAVSTVEAHLTRIYRKLGIRSRTDLARLVADGALDLPDSDPDTVEGRV